MAKPSNCTIEKTTLKANPQSPWEVIRVRATHNREEIGILIASFIPSGMVRKSRIDQDILAYLKISHGHGKIIVPPPYTCIELMGDQMAKSIEYGINDELHGWSRAARIMEIPSSRQERVDRIKLQLPELTRRFDGERQEFLSMHVDLPTISAMEVQSSCPGAGASLLLCREAMVWARGHGLPLYAKNQSRPGPGKILGKLLSRGLIHQFPDLQPNRATRKPQV